MSVVTKRPTVPAAEDILDGYFPVLDHGFVALVDYMGTDSSVERAARVSYGAGTRKVSETRGLIRYLRRHLHTTPSEMVEFKFHCAMPIFVARQWVRHRTASLNEYSARYSLLPLQFYMPREEQFLPQSTTNKQGREESSGGNRMTYLEADFRWHRGRDAASDDYQWLIGNDVARELARIDLPLSTYTQWYWKIDLHNLLHFLTLRCDSHAQWEIRQYADVIAGMVKRVAPLSYEAWVDYQLMGERFSRAELSALFRLLYVTEDEVIPVGGRSAGPATTHVVRLTNDDLGEIGLSPREIREFKAKLEGRDPPNHDLDLNTMRDPQEIAEQVSRHSIKGSA